MRASRTLAKGLQPDPASQRLGLSATGAGGQTTSISGTEFYPLGWTSHGPGSNLRSGLVRGGRSVLPKDSDSFDRFGYQLFRNGYRIRGDDLFDLEFVFDSNVFQDILGRIRSVSEIEPSLKRTEPFASVLAGGVPGEEAMVRRMLWEIIDKTDFARHIDPDRIIFFEDQPNAADGTGFQLAFLNQKLESLKQGPNALALTYEAQSRGTLERPFVQPKAVLDYQTLTAPLYPSRLIAGNRPNPDGTPNNWTILLSDDYSGIRVSPLELLRGILALKRILELNTSMPLTIEGFHVGRQVTFPSEEELSQGYHIIDRQVARLFYEVFNYYPAFEQEFNRVAQHMTEVLERLE